MISIQTIIHIIIICFLAMITHKLVSISGSYLHEIGRVQEPYAVFTFSDDRHDSMTVNILMNIFIPNICMIFLFVGVTFLKWDNITMLMMLYCISYYMYRLVLICLILDRRYLYNVKYELSITLIGVLLGVLLNIFFLQERNTLFISISELREELWFAIILVVYGTIKNVLDMKVKQDDVLTEQQLRTYIEKKFKNLYEKYGSDLNINSKNSYLCITLFAIMIFENFNRGLIIRLFEKIKVRTGHEATVGIMQVKSKHIITDAQSVAKAYNLIIQYGKDYSDCELSEWEVEKIAEKYNGGEKYSESVAYIYSRILEFIKSDEEFQEIFYIDSIEEVTEISQWNCSTVREMCNKLQNNCKIDLNKIEENILDGVEESEYVCVNRVENGWEIVLKNLHNVEINGNGSYLYSCFAKASVIVFEECYDVKIKGVKFGYKTDEKEFTGNIITMRDCDNVILENLELCGPGAVGIYTIDSGYSCKNLDIRKLLKGAIWSEDGQVEIIDTSIHDCSQCTSDLIYASDLFLLENVKIYNNYTDLAIINTNRTPFEFFNIQICNNTYRKKSFFVDSLTELKLENNKRLGWFD